MKWKNCVRLTIPTLAIALSSIVSQGCANSTGAPFHMYDSPLLEGRVESRYPRSRSYDPLRAGDHVEPTTHYAEKDDGAGPTSQPSNERAPMKKATAQKRVEPKTPALSTTRKAAPKTQTGAPATTEASSRAAHGDEKTRPKKSTSGKTAPAAEYVASVYELNGVDFSNAARTSIPTLFRECKERGQVYHSSRPAIGDLVFFHNTDDVNGDGRNNDWYTHVAIVESHTDDGRTQLLGYRSPGGGQGEVQRFVMDLESPDATQTRHGEIANAQLRAKRAQDPPFTQYLAGQLFAGTCSALGDRSQMIIIDNWRPGMKLEREVEQN